MHVTLFLAASAARLVEAHYRQVAASATYLIPAATTTIIFCSYPAFIFCLKHDSITLAGSELAPNMFGASSELAPNQLV